ncbi:hypothetical protein W97_05078 [Coniosporium apollinis CBS 100218]|uniref:Uncharacterized protein n=1 Tax=Coniosporium apollinis (strain CBS 100218) TaxID=1168221 RepID=R7YVY7_CONA1|nr:uncharacterized protein W97_05078 [Coniosporium apollinis CBS 100218]EON65836.1 hypothetical protein W97_05078 [Coniosporium apollinis CBS 100218]
MPIRVNSAYHSASLILQNSSHNAGFIDAEETYQPMCAEWTQQPLHESLSHQTCSSNPWEAPGPISASVAMICVGCVSATRWAIDDDVVVEASEILRESETCGVSAGVE